MTMQKIKITLSVAAMLLISIVACAERYAIIIGISNYPKESGFKPTSGVNDISYAREFLTANGFSINNIITLKDSEATYTAITNSLKSIEKIAMPGDVIFLHFSGHGQRVTDYSGDEPNKLDTAWIPYNAHSKQKPGYNGENHLIDDELNTLLHNIQNKITSRGRICVVVDACHSEGSTRELKTVRKARGIDTPFTVSDKDSKVIKSKNTKTKPELWLTLSACSQYEMNQEYTEKNCGLLTYILYHTEIKDLVKTISAAELRNKVAEKMDEIILKQYGARPQTPRLDGPDNLKAKPFLP